MNPSSSVGVQTRQSGLLKFAQEERKSHKIKAENVRAVNQGRTMHVKEFLEAWDSLEQSAEKRISLDYVHLSMQPKDKSAQAGRNGRN